MANMKRQGQHRRGITIIETALVLLMLLTITMGVIEYGWMFYKSHQLANAARQGARIGARPSSDEAITTAAVQSALTNAGITVVPTISVDPPPESVPAGTTFSVTVTLDYGELGLNMPLVPTPGSISSTVTMAREGP
jgi:Flp pilus assembly protein TadG